MGRITYSYSQHFCTPQFSLYLFIIYHIRHHRSCQVEYDWCSCSIFYGSSIMKRILHFCYHHLEYTHQFALFHQTNHCLMRNGTLCLAHKLLEWIPLTYLILLLFISYHYYRLMHMIVPNAAILPIIH